MIFSFGLGFGTLDWAADTRVTGTVHGEPPVAVRGAAAVAVVVLGPTDVDVELSVLARGAVLTVPVVGQMVVGGNLWGAEGGRVVHKHKEGAREE